MAAVLGPQLHRGRGHQVLCCDETPQEACPIQEGRSDGEIGLKHLRRFPPKPLPALLSVDAVGFGIGNPAVPCCLLCINFRKDVERPIFAIEDEAGLSIARRLYKHSRDAPCERSPMFAISCHARNQLPQLMLTEPIVTLGFVHCSPHDRTATKKRPSLPEWLEDDVSAVVIDFASIKLNCL
jgi:hypothetical protein